MYESTRNRRLNVNASHAIIHGMASDGGLFVPKTFEPFDFRALPSTISYAALTKLVLNHFLDDFTLDDFDFVDTAYADFQPVVGFHELENYDLLSLFHGPTFAFKDMALVLFSELLAKAKKKQGVELKTVILTATSGDTGSATLNGFKHDRKTDVIVFYPHEGISSFQEKQMLSMTDSNHLAIAIKGSFDDCQSLVKRAFSQLKQQKIGLSSANSINIARIVPQVVYYIFAYMTLISKGRMRFGERIDVTVPTGNFGNILSAYYAKMVGLPIDRLIVASNDNHVLTDFFRTGTYQTKRAFKKTISPSMDILVSSNLERLIYLKSNRDDVLIGSLMDELTKKGFYSLDARHMHAFTDFHAGHASETETLTTIRHTFDRENVLLDPHTAVAVAVYEKYLQEGGDRKPTVVVQTADPYKFSGAICQAFDQEVVFNDSSEEILALEKRTGIHAHENIKNLMTTRFKPMVWTQEEALNRLKEWIGEPHDSH